MLFVPTQPEKRNQAIVFVPPVSYYLSQQAHVRFLLFNASKDIGAGNFPGDPFDFPPGTTVNISYVGDDEVHLDEVNQTITSYTQVKTWYDTLIGNIYYRVYLVDAYLNTDDGYGGYIRVGVNFPDPDDYNYWGLTSFQVGAAGDALPGHCPFPNTEWPQTPAPTNSLPATWTPNAPNGTITPYPTINYTPQATAVGGTPYPTPNAIPIIFPTLPAQPTPTPWPVKRMPRVNYPDIPPANNNIQLGGIETPDTSGIDLGSIADGIENDWQGSTDFAEETLDFNNPDSTGGIGTPNELAASLVTDIGKPIGYVKAIASFMPNAWPFVLFLIGLAAWIVFNITAKFSLSIVAKSFEIIRRLIELIPGM